MDVTRKSLQERPFGGAPGTDRSSARGMQEKSSTASGAPDFPLISGSWRFCKGVRRGLKLLRRKAPEDYDHVLAYVGRIVEGTKSRMWSWETPPTMELDRAIVLWSDRMCALALVHEAHHAKFYCQRIAGGESGDIPDPVEEEKACFALDLPLLKRIGGWPEEIRWLQSQDGTHVLRKPRPKGRPGGVLRVIIRRFTGYL